MTAFSPDDDNSIEIFRKYLMINTVQPDPNYEPAISFLKELADEIGLVFHTIEVHPKKPVAILSWIGSDPSLPSIILNSHIDVVPVFEEYWTYDPFSAHRDEDGNIFARGSQDMKCVGIQYVEAVRRLKKSGQTLKRSIHMTFVPDEEIGGELGMGLYVNTDHFKSLNVGFALDEGIASETDVYSVYNAERNPWWLKVTCTGNPGHGSRFIKGTAAEKAQKIINKFMAFREQQKKLLESDDNLALGDVISVNLTQIHGGVQVNVVPSEYVLHFDIRVPPNVDFKKLEDQFAEWLNSAGTGVSFEYSQHSKVSAITAVDETNPFWMAFASTFSELGLKYKRSFFLGATDSRFLRMIDIPAINFSPMINTPILLHDHNEFLNDAVFVNGINVYTKIIAAIANV